MQESVYKRRVEPRRLPDDAPNILIVLIDDAGPGLPSTFGGEVHTPALDRVCKEGIAYNRFHTTAMCSPTRASLLTGRNHHHVGAGQIGELANDWDGYSGVIPKSCATAAEVLRHYGYTTGAWGKWHNTPAEQTTAAGPFDCWPTGFGFDYFYGFLTGEASQYEPNLVRNTTYVAPPRTHEEGYHLSEDLADDAIGWLHRHKAFQPDKPFYMYWASGAIHGPHHIMKEWADKYKGKFDDGWDKYRERVFARAKQKGWIPQDAQLTPRDPRMPSWDSIPEDEKPFQRRLMEVAAGFTEHVDVQVGRLVDEIDRLGYGENTLIFYIWGDNGSSAEGQNGTISELIAQNGIPTTVEHAHQGARGPRWARCARVSESRQPVPRGWGWAGSTPYKGMKLNASHFGGTRNPMAVRWPAKIKPDTTPRAAIPSCERCRADDLRGRRHHAASGGEWDRPGSDRRGEPGVFLRRSARPRPSVDAVLRGDGQPRDLSRRLDGIGVRATRALDSRAAAWHPRRGLRTRTRGSSTTSTRTGRRTTISRRRCRRSSRS